MGATSQQDVILDAFGAILSLQLPWLSLIILIQRQNPNYHSLTYVMLCYDSIMFNWIGVNFQREIKLINICWQIDVDNYWTNYLKRFFTLSHHMAHDAYHHYVELVEMQLMM